MPILNIVSGLAGTTGVSPSIAYIATSDTEAEILATGYLNQSVASGLASFSLPCMACVSTIASAGAQPDVGWYEVKYTTTSGAPVSAIWSLSSTIEPIDVALPTIANHIATYTNVDGGLGEDAATAINGGNLQAGLSGTAGTLASFPAAASKGSLILAAVANTGNTNVTISNAAHGQATVYSIGDIGATTGGIVVATTDIRMKVVAAASGAGGAAAQSFTDAFCTSGSVVVGNWVTQTNAEEIVKIVPGNGSFVVTSTGDVGAGTFSYVIYK